MSIENQGAKMTQENSDDQAVDLEKELLQKWLEIQEALGFRDKDVRKAITKRRSAPNRRVRKNLRALRKLIFGYSKDLLSLERQSKRASTGRKKRST